MMPYGKQNKMKVTHKVAVSILGTYLFYFISTSYNTVTQTYSSSLETPSLYLLTLFVEP